MELDNYKPTPWGEDEITEQMLCAMSHPFWWRGQEISGSKVAAVIKAYRAALNRIADLESQLK
jgi:hypothetical protein